MEAWVSSIDNTNQCKSIALIQAVVQWKHFYRVNTKILTASFNPLIKFKLYWWMKRIHVIWAIFPQYYFLPLLCWLILVGRNYDAYIVWWVTDHRHWALLIKDISMGFKTCIILASSQEPRHLTRTLTWTG